MVGNHDHDGAGREGKIQRWVAKRARQQGRSKRIRNSGIISGIPFEGASATAEKRRQQKGVCHQTSVKRYRTINHSRR